MRKLLFALLLLSICVPAYAGLGLLYNGQFNHASAYYNVTQIPLIEIGYTGTLESGQSVQWLNVIEETVSGGKILIDSGSYDVANIQNTYSLNGPEEEGIITNLSGAPISLNIPLYLTYVSGLFPPSMDGEIIMTLYEVVDGQSVYVDSLQVYSTPEPATLSLLALGAFLVGRRRRN